MTPRAREAFVNHVNAVLSDPALAMTEGRPHWDAKVDLLDSLGLFYRTTGRRMYLAAEMAVLYPGERGFSPDVLAVADLPNVVGDPRMAWIVADEGRGIDVAIEILHAGDRRKDLVDNVERYARVGVAEYFVFDRRDERVVGYHLPDADSRRYKRVIPQHGTVHSAVLGVDFAVQDGFLKVFVGTAELSRSREHIERLTGMLARVQSEAEVARSEADMARSEADTARSEGDEALALLGRERAAALEALRDLLIETLQTRGLSVAAPERAMIDAATSPALLRRWMMRALGATSTDGVFADPT